MAVPGIDFNGNRFPSTRRPGSVTRDLAIEDYLHIVVPIDGCLTLLMQPQPDPVSKAQAIICKHRTRIPTTNGNNGRQSGKM